MTNYTKIGFENGDQPLSQTNMVKIDEGIFAAHQKADQAKTTHIHSQITASATWTIVHNLNKYPSTTVVDSADTVVIGQIEYVSLNELKIIFSGGFSGKAYLN